MEHLVAMEQDAAKGENFFLGKILTNRGLYRHIWRYWKFSFCNNADIIELMLRIESTLEANLIESALKKKLSPFIAMMTLRHNYDWRDKPRMGSTQLLEKGFN